MTNEKETYNGWSNYATWRVKLEMLDTWGTYHTEDDDCEKFESVYDLSEHLKDYCEEQIETYRIGNRGGFNLAIDYAMAFLSDVNWREIAESTAEDYPQIIKAK